MSDTKQKILSSIENGHITSEAIAEQLGMADGSVRKVLAVMHDDGLVVRNETVRPYEYDTPAEPEFDAPDYDSVDFSDTLVDDEDGIPVSRDYDWEGKVPEPTEYVAANGEYERIMSIIDRRHETGSAMRFFLTGPPGTGKTTMPNAIGHDRGAPVFTVQGTYSMYDSDLIGSPIQVAGETKWVDATVTKALLCAQERETILVIDEINRTRPEALSVFYSVLDHRAEVGIPLRSGETVRARPDNLFVFATANVGKEYQGTAKMDPAMNRRLGRWIPIDHMGMHNPDREAAFISERAPVSTTFATRLVNAANDVRRLAQDDESRGPVKRGIPVSILIEWARDSYVHASEGLGDATLLAAEDTVIGLLYGTEPEAASEVRSIIEMRVGDADPLASEQPDAEADDEAEGDWDDQSLECANCNAQFAAGRADELDLYADFECPQCAGDLLPL